MLIKLPDESQEGGVPAWITTFSDCMTLLLTFFVLLLSFSSFDESALRRIFGALNCMSSPTILSNEQRTDDTLAPTREPVVDWTEEGAEKPDLETGELTLNPKQRRAVTDTDAYHEEKLLRIPSRRLFLGRGSALTQQGRDNLDRVAELMKLAPCQVIISEAGGADDDGRLARSWALVDFFTQTKGLAAERFCISASGASTTASAPGEPCMEMLLLARNITR